LCDQVLVLTGYDHRVSASKLPPRGRTHSDWLGHLLWDVSGRMSVLGEAAVADTPLTMPGLGLLHDVSEQPGVTIAELARTAPKSPQAISQIAARLEKLGFLERRLAAAGRGVGLHLTESGTRALEQGVRLEGEQEARLAAELGEQRYVQLCELLEQAREVVGGLVERHRRG
jgi:DNA-binding MarR family transcriptional regulator